MQKLKSSAQTGSPALPVEGILTGLAFSGSPGGLARGAGGWETTE